MVLNNQAALATLLKMVVVRSNIIEISPNGLSSGDSNIWDMYGKIVSSGEPFQEQVVIADFPLEIFLCEHMIDRREIPILMYEKIYQAAKSYGN